MVGRELSFTILLLKILVGHKCLVFR
ncbi:BnaC06g24300D [Brassica napus]|uniref:BnaC06g24300D protein n=1 Tax=Brassica napus TaxID=3708 RepID=A0A078IL49_BRANA|nr:BnaC06g24300D [Brassica napus]